MKKIFTLCLGIVIAVSSYATHLMGGQISANYINTNTSGSHYYLELDVYRDTLGVPMALSQSVEVFVLDSSGNYNLAFTQSLTFGVGGAVSSMSFVYGVEIYHFTDTITIPTNGSYMIKWTDCCRNGAIINMLSPLTENMTFLTYLNVDSSSPNSSPTFLSPPLSYLPTNTLWQYNPLPFDPDGDSLVWYISTPLSAGSGVSGVVSGYENLSDTTYSNSTGIFSVDSITGSISWNAKVAGNFVASFTIEEYRNGVLIGAMSRDMQFVVIPSAANVMPVISNIQSLPINNLGYPYIKIYPGQNYQVHLLASDANVNDVLSMNSFGEPFGLTTAASTFGFASTGSDNEIEGTFTWTPNMSQVRDNPYLVVFRVSDNFFYYDETIQIEVTNNTTDIEELSEFKVQDIYPNPANTNFTLPLSLAKAESVEISIYNALGVRISSEQLNLSQGNHMLVKYFDLQSGQYFVNVTDGNGLTIVTKKLLVVK
tara:strand:+ start:1882 stop:3330 length:1449 start_codon:yes stop_codon:yes gene_type:complete